MRAALNGGSPTVSIIIRSKNEEALLRETLSAIYAQTFQDFEVILVDSGSTDGTLAIARQFPVRVIEIRPEDFTYGRALNIGCAAARGKFLVFLSAHAVPLTSEWLARLLSHFDDAKVAGVWGGHTADRSVPPPMEIVRHDLAAFLKDFYFGFSNFNAAARRDIWREFLFDETLPSTEDKEWGYRVLQSGHLLVHDGSAYVLHYHHDNVLGIWRRSHKEHLAFACFLDISADALGFILRVIYWQTLGLWRHAAGWKERLGVFKVGLPKILERQIGRYTGLRKGQAVKRI